MNLKMYQLFQYYSKIKHKYQSLNEFNKGDVNNVKDNNINPM
jgi:hypothetical protein